MSAPKLPPDAAELRAILRKFEQHMLAAFAVEPHLADPKGAVPLIADAFRTLIANLNAWLDEYGDRDSSWRFVSPDDADALQRWLEDDPA